jgi:ankyrin repeat protein
MNLEEIEELIEDGRLKELEKVFGFQPEIIESMNQYGETILLTACGNGQNSIVSLLLKYGANIHQKNKYTGCTALHKACEKGYTELVKILLHNGSNLFELTKDGDSALHLAAENGHQNMIELLVDAGINVNITGNYGNTALHYCFTKGYLNVAILLLNRNANVNAIDDEGQTCLYKSCVDGHINMVKYLLESNYLNLIHIKAHDGMTALHVAALHGNVEIIELLLIYGSNIDEVCKDNTTAVHIAALWGHTNAVLLLLKHGANILTKTSSGFTLLHTACSCSHADELVISLLHEGLEIFVNDKDNFGRKPFELIENDYIKNYLLSYIVERNRALDSSLCMQEISNKQLQSEIETLKAKYNESEEAKNQAIRMQELISQQNVLLLQQINDANNDKIMNQDVANDSESKLFPPRKNNEIVDNNEVAILSEENKLLLSKVAELENFIGSISADRQLNNLSDNNSSKIKQLEFDLDNLTSNYNMLESNYMNINSELMSLKSAYNKLKENKQEIMQLFNTTMTEKKSLSLNIDELNDAINDKNSIIAQLHNEISNINTLNNDKLKRLEKNIASITNEKDGYLQSVIELTNLINTTDELNAGMNNNIQTLTKKVEQYEIDLNYKNNTIKLLKVEINDLNNRIVTMHKDFNNDMLIERDKAEKLFKEQQSSLLNDIQVIESLLIKEKEANRELSVLHHNQLEYVEKSRVLMVTILKALNVKGNSDVTENNVPSYRLLRDIMFVSNIISPIRDKIIDLTKKIVNSTNKLPFSSEIFVDNNQSLLDIDNEIVSPNNSFDALENYSIEDLIIDAMKRLDKRKEIQLNYELVKNTPLKNSSPVKSLKQGDNIIAIAPYDMSKYSNDDLYNSVTINNYINSPKVEGYKKNLTDNLEVPPSPLIIDTNKDDIMSNKREENDYLNPPYEVLTPGKTSFVKKIPLSASDKDNKSITNEYISPNKSPGRKMTWDCHE